MLRNNLVTACREMFDIVGKKYVVLLAGSYMCWCYCRSTTTIASQFDVVEKLVKSERDAKN
ncbi:hypothetical protein ANCCAN_12936 [Ancylostoma caninum]|uniref:Uncharacterized protein n=1 Tax=Ancylostoma caninum TaxID=29170 RepID=A0A368G9L7_ANCCA|nr:hypothetical protein ANCCAN_12936 [Ancylostoma caninum]